MSLETITFREQMADVRATVDMDSYEVLNGKYFKNTPWVEDVEKELAQPEFRRISEDHYRMLGLVTILFAKYGFEMMDGLKFRHAKYEWEKSFLHPKHLLASAVYAANLNVQSYPLKDRRAEELTDPGLIPIVYGQSIPVSSGKVTEYNMSQKVTCAVVESRALDNRPIALPYRRINQRISTIPYTNFDAETASNKEFAGKVLPQAERTLRGIVRSGDLFVAGNRNSYRTT